MFVGLEKLGLLLLIESTTPSWFLRKSMGLEKQGTLVVCTRPGLEDLLELKGEESINGGKPEDPISLPKFPNLTIPDRGIFFPPELF